jgi:hypothetical protein
MTSNLSKLSEQIARDLPISATDLVEAGYVSRTTLWRLQRGGMPVTRIGKRVFVKFSDLRNAGSSLQ